MLDRRKPLTLATIGGTQRCPPRPVCLLLPEREQKRMALGVAPPLISRMRH